MNIADLESKTLPELYQIAKELNLAGYYRLRKKELIFEILKGQTEKGGHLLPREFWKFLTGMDFSDPLLMCPVKTTFMYPLPKSEV